MNRLLLIVALWLSATVAMAHSPIKATTPADGGTVSAAPDHLQFTFNGGMRLTRVTVAFNEAAEIDLDVDLQDGFVTDYTISLPDLGAGVYEVTWRGLGEDGHAQTGAFSFTVG